MRYAFNKSESPIKRINPRPNLLMGQRFLRSPAVLKKIIAAADLSGKETVLEIGAGRGELTLELAKHAGKVVAVEKDKRLIEALTEKLRRAEIKNVQLIFDDILKIQISRFLNFSVSYKVVANIPYYLTGRLIRKFLTAEPPPSEMLLMVQREVAERIAARPPQMNLLAVSVQVYAEAEILFAVPAKAFTPPPKVDSALLRVSNISRDFFRAEGLDELEFFKLLRLAFGHKRKQLAGNLGAIFPKLSLMRALAAAGVKPTARPQELSIQQWAVIASLLDNPAAQN